MELEENGSYILTKEMQGDTVEATLRHVNFNGADLIVSYQQQLANSNLPSEEREEFLSDLTKGLKGYTYFEE